MGDGRLGEAGRTRERCGPAAAVGDRDLIRRLLRRIRYDTGPHLAVVDGVPLVVWRDVLDPVAFRGGQLLARAVTAEVTAAMRVLDLGAGCGVGAIFAARRGARVVAVDVNPAAVRCTRANAVLHEVDGRIDVREGDLYGPIGAQQFDRVLFNPPFYRGAPKSAFDAAFRSTDVPERFASGLRAALAPGGAAIVVLSTEGACDELRERLVSSGFIVEDIARDRYFGEVLTAIRAA